MGVWILKKVLYVGMFLGAFILTGCSFKQEQVKDEIKKEKTTERIVEVETLPDSFKEEVVPVPPLKLTQKQKKEYYKQYEEIVRKVNSKYDEDLELGPFEDFKPEEWVTPEDFRQIVIDMATMEFTSEVFGGDPVQDE